MRPAPNSPPADGVGAGQHLGPVPEPRPPRSPAPDGGLARLAVQLGAARLAAAVPDAAGQLGVVREVDAAGGAGRRPCRGRRSRAGSCRAAGRRPAGATARSTLASSSPHSQEPAAADVADLVDVPPVDVDQAARRRAQRRRSRRPPGRRGSPRPRTGRRAAPPRSGRSRRRSPARSARRRCPAAAACWNTVVSRLPAPRVDRRLPGQLVEQLVALGHQHLVADQAVRARRQAGAQSCPCWWRWWSGSPRSSVPVRSSCAAQERRVPGPLAQQQVAEAVDQQHARRGRSGRSASGPRRPARRRRPGAGRRPRLRDDRRHQVGQGVAAVLGCGQARARSPGATGCGRGQRPGEVQRAAQRLLAVGVGGDPQRDVVGAGRAGVAVVGVAVRVGAAGRLQVEAADPAPADGQRQLARPSPAR